LLSSLSFAIVLFSSSFELTCLSFFFVSHLSILQNSRYVAIYVRNIDEKLNITRKQIQTSKAFTFSLKNASYINLFYLNMHSAKPNPEYQGILLLIHVETTSPKLYKSNYRAISEETSLLYVTWKLKTNTNENQYNIAFKLI